MQYIEIYSQKKIGVTQPSKICALSASCTLGDPTYSIPNLTKAENKTDDYGSKNSGLGDILLSWDTALTIVTQDLNLTFPDWCWQR